MRDQIVRELLFDVGDGFGPHGASRRPLPAGMQVIPERAKAVVSSAAGVMIAEAVEFAVPDRTKPRDEQAFTKWDPDIIDGQVASLEVRDRQRTRPLSTSRMLSRCSAKRL